MSTTQQAILNVSCELIRTILPEGKTVADLEGLADESGQRFAWLGEALKLPASAKVTGVSTALRFPYDEVALRVECPDFVETPPGNRLPEVGLVITTGTNGKWAFLRWEGAAVSGPKARPEVAPTVKFREFL